MSELAVIKASYKLALANVNHIIDATGKIYIPKKASASEYGIDPITLTQADAKLANKIIALLKQADNAKSVIKYISTKTKEFTDF